MAGPEQARILFENTYTSLERTRTGQGEDKESPHHDEGLSAQKCFKEQVMAKNHKWHEKPFQGRQSCTADLGQPQCYGWIDSKYRLNCRRTGHQQLPQVGDRWPHTPHPWPNKKIDGLLQMFYNPRPSKQESYQCSIIMWHSSLDHTSRCSIETATWTHSLNMKITHILPLCATAARYTWGRSLIC